jgi:hypothetical protein
LPLQANWTLQLLNAQALTYARNLRAAVSFAAIRLAMTLPLPQLLQRSRFTKLAMGASDFIPKLASV